MSGGLTAAQQRVLDYIRADTSGEFIVVPKDVGNYVQTFDALVKLGYIEQEWRPAKLPPGSFEMVYRARKNA